MTARLRAVLVDDEPLAISRLARLLEATARVDVVGRAGDADAALARLADGGVDVVFLDIQMPGMSGLELATRLPPDVRVVFTTAYDRYAVKAFETSAVDYLLKPVERDRLDRTLDRLERPPGPASSDRVGAALAQLAEYLATHRPAFMERVTSRVGERVQVIEVAAVTHFFARDRGTYAATGTGSHLIDPTIADLERKVDPARFLRIHRGTLVNLAFVHELHPMPGGRMLVRLRDQARTELEVARDRVRALRDRLGA